MMRKIACICAAALCLTTLAGCAASAGSSFDASRAINVISREDGSGTRTAFIELFGIEAKNADGSKKDMTTKEAVIAKQTDVMLTNVAGDKYAIGYVSLGSLNDTVKAVGIGGAQATAANVKSGAYAVARPFYLALKGQPGALAQDFIAFILSREGQEVVAKNHYIAVGDTAAAFAGARPSGKLVVAGSSSVTPVMEKLKEAYLALNPAAAIEIQQSDSSAGMNAAIEGTCEIGMSSRELKEAEKEKLTPVMIALDGIAVIVNKDNPTSDLSREQVRDVFTGAAAEWSAVVK